MDTAPALVKSAVLDGGVSSVKFQKCSPKEFIPEAQYHALKNYSKTLWSWKRPFNIKITPLSIEEE